MVELDGANLIVSQGDTWRFVLELDGYTIQPTDRVYFSVKSSCMATALCSAATTGLSTNALYVTVPSVITRRFNPGPLMYDVYVINKDGIRTANFPAAIHVVCVAHDVATLPEDTDGSLPSIGDGSGMTNTSTVITIAVPPGWEDLEGAVQDAQAWAMSPDSPDGADDADSPTGKTMSAKSWAQQAAVAGQITAITNTQIDALFTESE